MNARADQFVLAGHNFAELGVSAAVQQALDSLPVDTLALMPWLHTSTMVQPPTNRWFSGLAFGSPAPVFPMPYSYIQTDQGFVFGLPHVTTTRHSISGPVSADIDVNVGACSFRIASYDLASVTIEFMNEIGRVLGRAVLAEGVPYISYTADVAHDVGLSEPFAMTYESCATAHVEGQHYGLVTTGAFSSRSIRLQPGEYFSIIALPQFAESDPVSVERSITRIARHATYPVLHTQLTGDVRGADVTTAIRYVARENGPVAVVRMDHHTVGTGVTGGAGTGVTAKAGAARSQDDVLGTYSTVYGTVELVSAKVLEWSTPKVVPQGPADLGSLTVDQRAEITRIATQELEASPRSPEDSYFAGKAFFRDANLLTVAEQLNLPQAQKFAAGLEERFLEWFRADAQSHDSRTFIFDDVWSGVVGREASFGTDTFNGHHFHWGYFLHVASILGARNPDLLAQVRPTVDALAFDIATPVTDTEVPALRVFDAYKGHSWSLGTASTDDGNSQESCSEAINAWNALGLWARSTDQAWLEDLAVWLLSLEVASTQKYWTNFNEDDPVRSAYQHSVVPLVGGAKHDYASWFSGEKSEMLGVVLVPMSAAASVFAADQDRILRNLEEVTGFFEDYSQPFGDYLLMYRALAGARSAERAWEIAVSLPQEIIDDGNSRAYMLSRIAECFTEL